MSTFDTSPVSFNVDVVGEVTGTVYSGVFRVKPVLTHSEQLFRDQLMRQFLGPNPKDASGRAISQAGILAEIQIRTVDAPHWWKDSNNGLSLFDELIIAKIYDCIVEVENKWKESIKSAAVKAKEALIELGSK